MKNIESIRVDTNEDLIFLTVGMHKMFLANGRAGQEAYQLYLHLMCQARMQATNQVHANLIYLSTGLEWGLNRVKRAKSFLVKKGLIEYVQRRNRQGQVQNTYIRLRFLMTAATLAEKISEEETEIREEDESQLTLEIESTGGTETVPPVGKEVAGSTDSIPPVKTTVDNPVDNPVNNSLVVRKTGRTANRAPGFDRQILKLNSLNALNEGGNSCRIRKELSTGTDPPPLNKKQVEEFLGEIEETARLFSDYTKPLRPEERDGALKLGGNYGYQKILSIWFSYQETKPGNPFSFFLEDFLKFLKRWEADEVRWKKRKSTEKICPACGGVISPYQAVCYTCRLSRTDFLNSEEIEKSRQYIDELQKDDAEGVVS